MSNVHKYKIFNEISEKLNQELNSVPVLYGSLGLSRSLGVEIKVDDIDLLIEEDIFTNKLPEVHRLMETLGFCLINTKENEFERGEVIVGIATDGDMLSFSGVDPTNLDVINTKASFRVLSVEQYLSTYKSSSLDGYRKDIKLKDDKSKIELIYSVIDA